MLKQLDTLIALVVVMSVVSLLITIITQMCSAILGLRGKNLADALEAMILKLDPKIDDQVDGLAKKVANQVLTRPVISDSILSMSRPWPPAWKRASAIRPDELLQVLKDIAGPSAVRAENSDALRETPAEAPTTPANAAERLLGLLATQSRETMQVVEAVKAQLPTLVAEKGAKVIHEIETMANPALISLEKWFNTAQDRAQQWFAMHTRIVTVIAAVVVAFGLQLDVLQLIHRISSDPDVRAKLVAQTDALQKQADAVLGNEPARLLAHEQAVSELQKTYPEIEDKLDQPPEATGTAVIDAWINSQLTGDPKKQEIVQAYHKHLKGAVGKKLAPFEDRLSEVNDGFKTTGLDLFPDPYPSFGKDWSWPWPHLLGILASAGLLSLGAPFWFNTLKSLTNLRPLLAREVEKDPKQLPTTGDSTE